MAHRKAVRKSRSQPTRKSVQAAKFPADRLPSELVHMVFAYLEPKEVAAFRWVGRAFAEIGLQYLTPKIHLELNEKSYDRLLAIAEHPIASKYVVELSYDTEQLKSIDRETFDRCLKRRSVIPQRHASSEMSNEVLSARAWRAYERESSRNKRETAQLMDRAWSIYGEYLISHEKVEQADFFREKMVEAFKQLPNLKMISASTTSVYGQHVAEIRKLSPTCYFDAGKEIPSINGGATKAVLLAAVSAGLQMNHFCCHRFSWQALTQDIRDMPALRRSMLHLKTMDIAFANVQHPHRLTPSEMGLVAALLVSFIMSAPNLEYLMLSTKPFPWSNRFSDTSLTLKEAIDKFYWPSLKTLSLDGVIATEDDLVHLCERHAHTLRELRLRDIGLYWGMWSTTFHRMRQAFRLGQQLDACQIAGPSRVDREPYSMPDTYEESDGPLGRLISNYIRATDIGDITLREYYKTIGLVRPPEWPDF